jgi:recombination protein RecT
MPKQETQVAKIATGQVTKIEKTPSERFSEMVIREFAGTGGKISITASQQRLISNYFISLDQTLKLAEEKRLNTDEKYRAKLSFEWKNINMERLATDVVACARVGLDPALPNHLALIPYNNKHTGKYDISFREEYRGKEVVAKKYGLDIPDDVVIELVYEKDVFTTIKKDKDNPIETYTFKVSDSFNRGEIIGGFWYHKFKEDPSKNKLMTYSRVQLEKYRPEKASAEFWGGEKDNWVWDDEKKKNVKKGTIKIDGWIPEMLYKTLYHRAYNAITLDSRKIDDDFIKISIMEKEAIETLEEGVRKEISENANQKIIDIPHEEVKPSDAIPAETQTIPSEQQTKDGQNEIPTKGSVIQGTLSPDF